MDILKEVQAVLRQQDPQEKDTLLSVLDDVFEYHHGVNEDDIAEGVRLLLAAALQEKDQNVRQLFFRTIDKAIVYHNIGTRIDLDRLVTFLPSLGRNELEYVLELLGWSGQAKYLPILEEYTHHPDPDTSESARDAIEAMHYRISQNAASQKPE
jgi:hypothetical protein